MQMLGMLLRSRLLNLTRVVERELSEKDDAPSLPQNGGFRTRFGSGFLACSNDHGSSSPTHVGCLPGLVWGFVCSNWEVRDGNTTSLGPPKPNISDL